MPKGKKMLKNLYKYDKLSVMLRLIRIYAVFFTDLYLWNLLYKRGNMLSKFDPLLHLTFSMKILLYNKLPIPYIFRKLKILSSEMF